MYILDHFTSLDKMNPTIIDSTEAWCYLLGEVICSPDEHISVVKETVFKHMASIDDYIDAMSHEELRKGGLGDIDSLYKLLIYIINNFNKLTLSVNKPSSFNSLYFKHLQVNNFILYDLVKEINKMYFSLNTLRINQEKDTRKDIKFEEIKRILDNLNPNTVMRIKQNAVAMPLEDPTDCHLFKQGRFVVPQEKSDRNKTSRIPITPYDIGNTLHPTMMEVGAVYDMSKADPSGHNRINLFVHLDSNLTIIPNPKLTNFINYLNEKLFS